MPALQLSNVHPSTYPGPHDIARTVLPNGIVVLSRSNHNNPSVVINGTLSAGSIFDSDEKLGLSDFVTSALMRGNEQRDFEQIYDSLELVGASLGFSAGTISVGFSGRCLVEDLPLLFELLAETLRRPTFPKKELDKLRPQLLTSLAIRGQDTADMASMAFDEMVYAGHPFRRPDDGFPETVRAITRKDIVDFHRQFFGPQGLIISVAGAVEAEAVTGLVEKSLGDWENARQPHLPGLPDIRPVTSIQRKHVTLPGKSQSDLMIGAIGPSRTSPDYLAASLGNSVLGQFGMMGRIGEVVREQSGLAYYAYSSLSAGFGPGTWEVSAGVSPANVEKAIELVRIELQRFVENGISVDELADSQDNYVGRLPLSLELNGGVAGSLLNIERFNLGLDYFQRYESLVRAVTPEQVVETARKYLDPARLSIASCGA